MSDRDEIERLNAEVDRLREERGPISNAEYAARVCELRERCDALRARLAAADGLLESIRDQANHDGCEECWLACADIDAHLAVEPEPTEPAPVCETCGGRRRVCGEHPECERLLTGLVVCQWHGTSKPCPKCGEEE